MAPMTTWAANDDGTVSEILSPARKRAIDSLASPAMPAVRPRALAEQEIIDVIAAFADATRRAIAAGFDGIELHGAHAFLIQSIFSPYANRREDRWGDSLENRMRFRWQWSKR